MYIQHPTNHIHCLTLVQFKYGVAPNQTYLEWHVSSQPQWGVEWEAGVWYNFAYDIDVSPFLVSAPVRYWLNGEHSFLLTPLVSGRRPGPTRS